jgi:hypothetical protein
MYTLSISIDGSKLSQMWRMFVEDGIDEHTNSQSCQTGGHEELLGEHVDEYYAIDFSIVSARFPSKLRKV